MTDEQKRMVRILSQCTFLPGSYDKRFVKDLACVIRAHESTKDAPSVWVPLTEKQAAYLVKCFHKYRRQHGACRCEECAK